MRAPMSLNPPQNPIVFALLATFALTSCGDGPERPDTPAVEREIPEVAGASEAELQRLAALGELLGGTLVYAKLNPGDHWEIRTRSIGGAGNDWTARTIIATGRHPRWSPDGNRVAFFRAAEPPAGADPAFWMPGALWVADADGGGERMVTASAAAAEFGGTCPHDFHPDGGHLIFVTAGGELRIVALDGSGERPFFADAAPHYLGEPQLDLAGALLGIRGTSAAVGGAYERPVLLCDVAAEAESAFASGCCPAVSPDGAWATANSPHHRQMYVWSTDLDHEAVLEARALIEPQGLWDNWHWSNHPRFLAVKSDGKPHNGKPDDAFVLDVAEGTATRVTFDADIDYPDLFVASGPAHESVAPAVLGWRPADARANMERLAAAKRAAADGVATVIARAELVARPTVPDPAVLPYKDYYAEFEWQLLEVVEGAWFAWRFLAVHQVVKDRKLVPPAVAPQPGDRATLVLQPWEDRPDLHNLGLLLLDDPSAFDLPIYFSTGR